MPPIPAFFDDDLSDYPGSGTVTPDDEKIPRFSHELCEPPPGGETLPATRYEPTKSRLSIQEAVVYDFDDPSLEPFPTERIAIFEHIRKCEARLPEDEVRIEGIPPSPVVGTRKQPERIEVPSASPGLLITEPSPSLDSIPEDGEEGYREEMLAALSKGTNLNSSNGEPQMESGTEEKQKPVQEARQPSVDVQEVTQTPPSQHADSTETPPNFDITSMDGSYMEPGRVKLPVTPFVHDNSKQLGEPEQEPGMKDAVTPEEGPQITVQPATPGSSLKTTTTNPFEKPVNAAKSSALEEQTGRSQLASRKPAAPSPERPLTPTSIRSAGKDVKSRNFLKAFWRVVFVEWIGGFIIRLCGGDRKKANT
jgi:hypothetical protein